MTHPSYTVRMEDDDQGHVAIHWPGEDVIAARADHAPSQVTRIEDPAEPKALRNPKYYKYQALLPRIVAFIELDRKSRSKNYDHPPQVGTIVGSEQLGTRSVLSEEVAYIGLPIKPQFKQNIERTYKEMQRNTGFVWGT